MKTTETADYRLEQSQFGLSAVLTSDWNAKIRRELLQQPIAELELNRGKGWHGRDISFVSDFPELLSLKIIGTTAETESPIHALHNLRALHLLTYCKTEIQFMEFPRLVECSLQWRSKATSLFACEGLRCLFVNGYKGGDTVPFGKLRNLQTLEILGSPIKSLEGLTSLSSLRSLRLGALRVLETLEGVQDLTQLEKLEINTCRKIKSVGEIAQLENLLEVYLDNLGDIPSLKPLKNLIHLRRLTFIESTNIVDGDLTPLLALPDLEMISFQNRKHYSHSRERLRQILGLGGHIPHC